ncbi:MAG: hypothetical protein LBG19_10510 [Prevotellaceae bacterium]|jgi:hypothetical protein|nr:hypothetical protein [Prevotellaceae bacterium]
MRNIVIVSLLFFLLPFSEVEGQEKDTAIVRDKYARPSERGDLELLVRRVYEAF